MSNDVKNLPESSMYYQTVNNPDYAVMGMFIGPENRMNITNFYALVDSRQSDPKLIITASNWTEIFPGPPSSAGSIHALRPDCREGFSSVSDFQCVNTGDPPGCLSFLPKILPCIANGCLTRCSAILSGPGYPPAYYITNGFQVFGNGNAEIRFWRYSDSTPDESLLVCLTSECVAEF